MRRQSLIALVATLCLLLAGIWGIGWWTSALVWVLEQQRQFHRQMAEGLGALEQGRGAATAWTLITVSFLYGIFHAAGPGHGKAVIATYLLTHPSRMQRAVLLAAAASLCQGLAAVALVMGLTGLAGWLPHDARQAVTYSEQASFLLLAGIGGMLAWRAARTLAKGHHPHHAHGPGCGCAHTPSPRQMVGADGIKANVGILLSVGLRPCSGAVLVLALANTLDLAWAGIAAIAAMSTGTAITVATLAVVTVKARHWAFILLRGGTEPHPRLGALAALAGGLIILGFGISLFVASLGPAHPLRL